MKFERFKDNRYFIVEDGLLSHYELGEGRMIPGLIVNSKYGDSDLEELIEHHKESLSGDMTVHWGLPLKSILKKNRLYLHIKFIQPMEVKFQVEFNVNEHYSLIESIIISRSLHLGVGKKGDKVSKVAASGNLIVIEVPDTGFDLKWEKKLQETVRKNIKKQGIPKKQLKEETAKHIKEMRKILKLRLKTE